MGSGGRVQPATQMLQYNSQPGALWALQGPGAPLNMIQSFPPVPLHGVTWVLPAPSGLTCFNQLELVTLSQLTSLGLPRWPSGKESAHNAGASGDAGSIPGWGRSPGGGHGNPLQYSCLENLMDRGARQAIVHGVAKTGHELVTKPPPPV